MKLEDLGYNSQLEAYRKEKNLHSFSVGRVISEHKERYVVKTENGEFDAELLGALRFTAESRLDFPAVGDWLAISEYDDDKALIHAIFPRKSIIERQAVGKVGQKQIIATNIDCALIVQAVDRDFNVNRLERYLTISYNAGVKALIVLSKTDLIPAEELRKIREEVAERIDNVTLINVSSELEDGYRELKSYIRSGETYCLLGSSGVGKSTLLNAISGKDLMKTDAISQSTNKGRHTTSYRELVILNSGGILIDNPGMREIGIADSGGGLELTFDAISSLSQQCRFNDCTHVHEKGCAVLEALNNGEFDQDSYDNFMKLQRERMHFEATIQEKRKKEKDFGKMIKSVLQEKKKYKY